jgi:hypothetical protein
MANNIEVLLYIRIIKTNDIIPNICDDECKALRPKGPKAGLNQKKRKETRDRPEGTSQGYSCRRCGRQGHNIRNKKECPT